MLNKFYRGLFITVFSTFIPLQATLAEPNISMFSSLPNKADNPDNPSTPEKIQLGKRLYFEKKLSLAGDISCNSCHNLKNFGVDNEPTSPGHQGQRGDRNSPSVYNAALHFAQFWDGRAKDVEEQALGPILNPKEMAMPDEAAVLARLNADKTYPQQFKKAFPGEPNPVSYTNVGKAIGAFERTLLTSSRFDQYLQGQKEALTAAEKTGLETFVNTGCIACHNGILLGGQMYQKLGLVIPYATTDLGRFAVTQNEADKFIFKVPSLRNVAKTAPYFHDGKVTKLEDAVKLMAKHQLGRDLSTTDIESIVNFLNSLTGTLPKNID